MARQRIGILLAACMLALAAAGAARAQDYPNLEDYAGAKVDRGAEWYRACMKVQDLQPPKADAPSAQLVAALGECDAVDLYYDTQDRPAATQAEWDKVRACAVSNDDHAVLTMLYANGQGVKFNPALALHYACGGNGMAIDPRDVAEDMMDLESSAHPPVPPYDICDNATTARARVLCGQIDEEEADNADAQKLEALARNWPANQKQALAALRAAALAYADAWGDEADQAAVAAQGENPDTIGEERMRQKALFMQDIANAEKGILPHYSRAQYDALDKDLGAAYMESQIPEGGGQGGQADAVMNAMDTTQHAWLAYRDAWVAFGKLRYPTVPGYAWKAMLTERRLEQLEQDDSDE